MKYPLFPHDLWAGPPWTVKKQQHTLTQILTFFLSDIITVRVVVPY